MICVLPKIYPTIYHSRVNVFNHQGVPPGNSSGAAPLVRQAHSGAPSPPKKWSINPDACLIIHTSFLKCTSLPVFQFYLYRLGQIDPSAVLLHPKNKITYNIKPIFCSLSFYITFCNPWIAQWLSFCT